MLAHRLNRRDLRVCIASLISGLAGLISFMVIFSTALPAAVLLGEDGPPKVIPNIAALLKGANDFALAQRYTEAAAKYSEAVAAAELLSEEKKQILADVLTW